MSKKNINDFIEKMKEAVKACLPEEDKDIIIDDVTVVKMNDQKLTGLTFKEPGNDAAPTLYINEMFEAYEHGVDISHLANEIAGMYAESKTAPVPPQVKLSWDNVKEKLTVRLLEKQRNRDFLATMPYKSVGQGLALIADINMGEGRGEWRIAVNNSVLAELGVNEETLFEDAMASAVVYDPAELVDMGSALFSPEKVNLLNRDEPLNPDEVGGMYVLTNKSGSLGAAALFYPDVKEKTAELLGRDYYILPSSIHEVIIVPDSMDIKAKELCDMVKQANRTVVEPNDILSDQVYHYSKATGFEKVVSEESKETAA